MELIAKMKVRVIVHEHPNAIKKEDTKEKEARTYFHSKLLTATFWSKDVLDVSLEKLNATRSRSM